MVKTYKSAYMKEGLYNGVISEISLEDNDFYKPGDDESAFNCPEKLIIKFAFSNGLEFEQKFVQPSQDYGLFSELCQVFEAEWGEDDSEEFDEQQLLGLECSVLLENIENKKSGKSYITAVRAAKTGVDPRQPNATVEEVEEEEEKPAAKKKA